MLRLCLHLAHKVFLERKTVFTKSLENIQIFRNREELPYAFCNFRSNSFDLGHIYLVSYNERIN